MHAAPTGPTPQATPQGVEHPYGTPGAQQQELNIIQNADGSQSIKHEDGTLEPYSGDRSMAVRYVLLCYDTEEGLTGCDVEFRDESAAWRREEAEFGWLGRTCEFVSGRRFQPWE